MIRVPPGQAFFPFVVLWIVLLICTVPAFLAAALSGIATFVLSRSGRVWAPALVATPLAITVLGGEVLLRALPADLRPHYYRPHEVLIYAGADGPLANYRPNRTVEGFQVRFGDLVAMSSRASLAEPRTVRFVTDELGLRNTADYSDQPIVVFGDSFVVGSGTTQAEILSEVLSRDFGLPAYNAGMPGDIADYVERIAYLDDLFDGGFEAVVVLFEGNDFPCRRGSKRRSSVRRRLVWIPALIRNLETYRFVYSASRRAYSRLSSRAGGRLRSVDDDPISTESVGGEELGFLKSYVRVATRRDPCLSSHDRMLLAEVADRVALLVFVPTKYRVYSSLVDGKRHRALSNAQVEALELMAADLEVPFLDLTPELTQASRLHLAHGEYTFWRDDTHWNGRGIRVAARAIAERLEVVSP